MRPPGSWTRRTAAKTWAALRPGAALAWARVTHWKPAGWLVPSGRCRVRRAKKRPWLEQGVAEHSPAAACCRLGEQAMRWVKNARGSRLTLRAGEWQPERLLPESRTTSPDPIRSAIVSVPHADAADRSAGRATSSDAATPRITSRQVVLRPRRTSAPLVEQRHVAHQPLVGVGRLGQREAQLVALGRDGAQQASGLVLDPHGRRAQNADD